MCLNIFRFKKPSWKAATMNNINHKPRTGLPWTFRGLQMDLARHMETVDYNDVIDPEGTKAHFTNRARRNWLALYERYGLDVVACPWDAYPRNVEAMTDYARRHRVLGGLLTEWERSPRFSPGQPALPVFAGALWKGRAYDPESAWRPAMKALLPGAPKSLQDGVREWMRVGGRLSPGSLQSFLCGLPVREEALQRAVAMLADTAFRICGFSSCPKAGAGRLRKVASSRPRLSTAAPEGIMMFTFLLPCPDVPTALNWMHGDTAGKGWHSSNYRIHF